jgi:hypothetical protein
VGANLLDVSGVALVLYEVSSSGSTQTLTAVSAPKANAQSLLAAILKTRTLPIPSSSLSAGTYAPLICPADSSGNPVADCSMSLSSHNSRGISMSNVTLGKSDLGPSQKFPGSSLVTFTINADGSLTANGSLGVLYGTNKENESCQINQSPLMIHLDSIGNSQVVLSSPANGVKFDISNNGTHPQISWPVNPNVDVFLALPDSNGQVSSSQQLFGNTTVGPDGKTAANGFLALAKYAPPGAQSLDSTSPVYSQLRLWADTNRNGVVDPGELSSLKDNGVLSINLNYQYMNETDLYGNKTEERSLVDTSAHHRLLIFDVWFALP